MTRSPDHHRSRAFRGAEGHSYTSGHISPGLSGNTSTRGGNGSPRSARPADEGAGSENPALRGFELPPIDVEIDLETTPRKSELWVRLRGEADLANHEQLHEELKRATLDQADEVHLVLDELTFCDLYAFRQLLHFATEVRERGRELFSHGACPSLKKMARLLDVTQELHFV